MISRVAGVGDNVRMDREYAAMYEDDPDWTLIDFGSPITEFHETIRHGLTEGNETIRYGMNAAGETIRYAAHDANDTVRTVAENINETARHGIDSATFFGILAFAGLAWLASSSR